MKGDLFSYLNIFCKFIPLKFSGFLKSATKPFNVLLACTHPLITEFADSSGTQLKSSGTQLKSSGTRQKTSDKIIEMIKKDPQITAPQIAMELGISTRGVEKNLRQLRETGTLKRVGSPTFGGYWEIVNLDND